MIDAFADRPVYLQVADVLRERITTGELRAGMSLPAETRLAQEYAVGRDTVRSAMAILRAEGLIETVRPHGNRVRDRNRIVVLLELGSELVFRPATTDERARLKLPVGAHVAQVSPADGESVIYVADRHIFRSI